MAKSQSLQPFRIIHEEGVDPNRVFINVDSGVKEKRYTYELESPEDLKKLGFSKSDIEERQNQPIGPRFRGTLKSTAQLRPLFEGMRYRKPGGKKQELLKVTPEGLQTEWEYTATGAPAPPGVETRSVRGRTEWGTYKGSVYASDPFLHKALSEDITFGETAEDFGLPEPTPETPYEKYFEAQKAKGESPEAISQAWAQAQQKKTTEPMATKTQTTEQPTPTKYYGKYSGGKRVFGKTPAEVIEQGAGEPMEWFGYRGGEWTRVEDVTPTEPTEPTTQPPTKPSPEKPWGEGYWTIEPENIIPGAVSYEDLEERDGTIFLKGRVTEEGWTGPGAYTSEQDLATALGIKPHQIEWDRIGKKTKEVSEPSKEEKPARKPSEEAVEGAEVGYGDLVNRAGTIYNTKTGEAYGKGMSPEKAQAELASDLGIQPHQIEWGKIKEEGPSPEDQLAQGSEATREEQQEAEEDERQQKQQEIADKEDEVYSKQLDAEIAELEAMEEEEFPTPTFESDYEAMRAERGMEALETQINNKKQLMRDLDESLRQGLYDEEGKLRPMELIGTRQKEMREQSRRQKSQIQRELQTLVDEYNVKQAAISNIMKYKQLDYQASVDEYNNEFNRQINLINALEGRESMELRRANMEQDNARANLNTMLNSFEGVSWNELDTDTRSQIENLEMKAELPVGITEAFMAGNKDKKVLLTKTTGYDENGNQIVSFIYEDEEGRPGAVEMVKTGGKKVEKVNWELRKVGDKLYRVNPDTGSLELLTEGGDGGVTPKTLAKDYFTDSQLARGAAAAEMSVTEFGNLTIDEANKYIYGEEEETEVYLTDDNISNIAIQLVKKYGKEDAIGKAKVGKLKISGKERDLTQEQIDKIVDKINEEYPEGRTFWQGLLPGGK